MKLASPTAVQRVGKAYEGVGLCSLMRLLGKKIYRKGIWSNYVIPVLNIHWQAHTAAWCKRLCALGKRLTAVRHFWVLLVFQKYQIGFWLVMCYIFANYSSVQKVKMKMSQINAIKQFIFFFLLDQKEAKSKIREGWCGMVAGMNKKSRQH